MPALCYSVVHEHKQNFQFPHEKFGAVCEYGAVPGGECASRAVFSSAFYYWKGNLHCSPVKVVVCSSRTGRTQDPKLVSIYFIHMIVGYI